VPDARTTRLDRDVGVAGDVLDAQLAVPEAEVCPAHPRDGRVAVIEGEAGCSEGPGEVHRAVLERDGDIGCRRHANDDVDRVARAEDVEAERPDDAHLAACARHAHRLGGAAVPRTVRLGRCDVHIDVVARFGDDLDASHLDLHAEEGRP
jgi:hypothetical protein